MGEKLDFLEARATELFSWVPLLFPLLMQFFAALRAAAAARIAETAGAALPERAEDEVEAAEPSAVLRQAGVVGRGRRVRARRSARGVVAAEPIEDSRDVAMTYGEQAAGAACCGREGGREVFKNFQKSGGAAMWNHVIFVTI